MRIAALQPDIAEVVCSLGLAEQVVATCSGCDSPALAHAKRITTALLPGAQTSTLDDLICSERVDLELLRAAAVDVVLTRVPVNDESDTMLNQVRSLLKGDLGDDLKFHSYHPNTINGVLAYFEAIGADLGQPVRGKEIASRMKAQFMDWGDNFYDRMKNKKVTFLSSVEPLRLAGRWVPDMIHLASAMSHAPSTGNDDLETSWEDILRFRPDVIVVAPRGNTLQQSMKSFHEFEKRVDWESIPAVKRGEVIFAQGMHHFYHASNDLIESMAVLISAIAGLESGYITPRDSFFRLRWLELHRHRV